MLDVRRFRADLWMKSFLKYWLPVLVWLVVTFIGSTNVMSVENTSRFIVPFLLGLLGIYVDIYLSLAIGVLIAAVIEILTRVFERRKTA